MKNLRLLAFVAAVVGLMAGTAAGQEWAQGKN
jgi:hypothetical protein